MEEAYLYLRTCRAYLYLYLDGWDVCKYGARGGEGSEIYFCCRGLLSPGFRPPRRFARGVSSSPARGESGASTPLKRPEVDGCTASGPTAGRSPLTTGSAESPHGRGMGLQGAAGGAVECLHRARYRTLSRHVQHGGLSWRRARAASDCYAMNPVQPSTPSWVR